PLPAPDGDGAALSGSDGFTFTINNAPHTVTAGQHPIPMRWFRTGSGPSAMFDFDGSSTTSDIPTLKLSGLPSTGQGNFPLPKTGSFNCDEKEGKPYIYISMNDTAQTLYVSAGASCTIEIIEATATTVTGRFSAHFTSNNGTLGKTYTVSDGYF
ncbi:MAG: hypothetical protein VW625_07280, partial [Perlucidibaca sp.]